MPIDKHFTASALIINNEGNILLVNHRKLGVWLYPGGHVEREETPDETVIREVKEETGLDVKIKGEIDNSLADHENKVSVLQIPFQILCERIGDDDEHYHIDLIYLCEILNEGQNTITHNKRESNDIAFFSLEDLKDIKLFPNFRILLEKVLAGVTQKT